MPLHLNYDGNQNNGVIFNDLYPSGCLFTGADLKPSLSFNYHSFEYSEVFSNRPNFMMDMNGNKRLLTADEIIEITTLASGWVQPLGQEGNPTPAQQKEAQKALIRASYSEAEKTPVDFNGVQYNGGESSAAAIYNAVVMAREANALGANITEVNITGMDNKPNTLSLPDAIALAISIGTASQQNFFKKQTLKVQIDAIDEASQTAVDDIKTIVWA